MPHGTPDWGGLVGDTYILSEDLAELAARIFSINTYDRRGKVVWWDDFRGGMNGWTTATSGTGAAVALSTAHPKWSPFCVKMTAGSDTLRQAYLLRYLGEWGVDAIGFELSVAFPTAFSSFYCGLGLYDGVTHHQAACILSDVNDKIYYNDEDGASQELDDLMLTTPDGVPYITMKLVADFTEDKYVRFMVDRDEYDLSAYSLYAAANTTYRYLLIAARLTGRAGENDYCYVDGVIVTQEEE